MKIGMTYIYDEKFCRIGVICDLTSLVYTKEFDGAGELRLCMSCGAPAESLLAPDRYICVPDGTMYLITSVVRDAEGTVTISGEGLLSLIGRTVAPEEYSMTGGAGTLLRALFRRCRDNMPAATAVEGTLEGVRMTYSAVRGNILTHMRDICRTSGLGMALEYKNSKLTFYARSARDRTITSDAPMCVTVSPDFAGEYSYTEDLSSYRNVAVVSGAEKEDGTRRQAIVRADALSFGDSFDDSAFSDRQTLALFTEALSKFTDTVEDGRVLNEEKYEAAMKAHGAAVLARMRPKYTLTCAVADDGSLEAGDAVSLFEKRYGISGTATVTKKRVEYRDSECASTVYLTTDSRRITGA